MSQAQPAGELADVVTLVGGHERDPDALGLRRGRCGRCGERRSRRRAGGSKLITCEIPLTSIPRAATSVATSMSTAPDSKRASACSRWRCDLLPCIATASTPWRAQALDQPVGAVLGANEHERQLAVALQLADERFDAVLMCDLDEPVLDIARCAPGRRAVLVDDGIVGVSPGEPAGLAVERGREEQRLAVAAGRRRRSGRPPVESPCRASGRPRRGRGSGRASSVKAPRASRSSSRPGVATSTCERGGVPCLLDQADAAVHGGRPAARGHGRSRESRPRSGVASSRVGASTSAAGRGSSAAIRSTSGIPKASVLPEPVGDFASTSRPARTSPMTSRWIANGCVIPCAESEPRTARETPRSAKDCVDMHDSLAALGPRTIREAMADPNR